MASGSRTRFRLYHPLARMLAGFAVVSAVVAVALCGYYRSADIGRVVAAPLPPPHTSLFDIVPSLLVVGDSFAADIGSTESMTTYPELLAETMNCKLEADVVADRGFLPRVDNGKTVRALRDTLDFDLVNYKPQYVVIDNGRYDHDHPLGEVIGALNDYLLALRAGYRDATIAVIVPSFANEQPDNNYLSLADAMTRSAEAVGAHVIDPLGERWYTTVDMARLVSEDGAHLNELGKKYYAQRISADLGRWEASAEGWTSQETR